jgi:shikimate dehydrogenase
MGQDKIFGLIGNNLKNTFSKNYFEQKFLENKLNYAYQNFELNEIDGVLDLIKQNENLFGLNFTIPFKKQIIPLIHEIE